METAVLYHDQSVYEALHTFFELARTEYSNGLRRPLSKEITQMCPYRVLTSTLRCHNPSILTTSNTLIRLCSLQADVNH